MASFFCRFGFLQLCWFLHLKKKESPASRLPLNFPLPYSFSLQSLVSGITYLIFLGRGWQGNLFIVTDCEMTRFVRLCRCHCSADSLFPRTVCTSQRAGNECPSLRLHSPFPERHNEGEGAFTKCHRTHNYNTSFNQRDKMQMWSIFLITCQIRNSLRQPYTMRASCAG